MHVAVSIHQLNTITAQLNAQMRKRGQDAYPQDLRLTQEGMGDIRVDYYLVTPSDTRGVPYNFSIKLDGRRAS